MVWVLFSQAGNQSWTWTPTSFSFHGKGFQVSFKNQNPCKLGSSQPKTIGTRSHETPNTQNTAIKLFLGGWKTGQLETKFRHAEIPVPQYSIEFLPNNCIPQEHWTNRQQKALKLGCNLRLTFEFYFWSWWPVIYRPIEYCFLLLAKRDDGSLDDHDHRWWVEFNGCPMYLHTHWVDVRQSIRWSLRLFGYGIALGGGYPCAIPVTISEKQPVAVSLSLRLKSSTTDWRVFSVK